MFETGLLEYILCNINYAKYINVLCSVEFLITS